MKTIPASSRQLSAFALDIEFELMQTSLFSKVSIKKSGMPECALVVTCALKNGTTTTTEVSTLLEHLWEESLMYQGSENTSRIVASSERVTLEFATDDPRVTGCIEVSGFHRASVLKIIRQ